MVLNVNGNKKYAQKKEPLFSFPEIIVLVFLFLAAMNFINKYAYCVFIAFAAFLIFRGNHIRVSNKIVIFILFSLSLLIFWPLGNSSITAMLRTFAFPLCFSVGYNLPSKNTDLKSREQAFKILAVILALGTWIHMMLNFSINFENEEEIRNTTDFWVDMEISATGQATLACLTIAVAVAILFSENKIWQKVLAIVTTVLAFYYNLILAGRSMFILLLIAATLAIIYFLKCSQKLSKSIIVILCVIGTIAIFLYIYDNNVFGVKEIIEDSNFYYRFFDETSKAELNEDVRGERKLEYLKYLVDYPFGGGKIREIVDGYAHDLYLDTYDGAGVFSFFLIVVIVGDFAVRTFKALKNKQISFETRQLTLCLFVVFNVVFWMEPILEGMTWLLSCFCLIHGNLCGLTETAEEKRREETI